MQIKFESVNHIYNANTPMEQRALYDINFDIKDGQFLAIVGHTGSGKSTLIQHMNGLLKPSSGSITIGDKMIKPDEKNKGLKEIRQYVGLVFQFLQTIDIRDTETPALPESEAREVPSDFPRYPFR